MADMTKPKVLFELVTPTALIFSEDVDMVVVPGIEGDFGVLHGHTPVLTTIRPGVISVYTGDEVTKAFFVEGGFAEANPEGCTVLADGATEISEISAEDAQARLTAARDAVGDSGDAAKGNEVKVAEAMVVATGGNATQH